MGSSMPPPAALGLGRSAAHRPCACLLALGMCYYVRLDDMGARDQYQSMIENRFGLADNMFAEVLLCEQRDILARMDYDLYPIIAHNGALLENVFVAFVCIRSRQQCTNCNCNYLLYTRIVRN